MRYTKGSLGSSRMKLLLILLLIFGCSDNYDMIDDKTRFNKRNGEIELLQESGQWIQKKEIIKQQENNNQINNKFSENNMTYFLF